jgi:hypothetical protein
MIDIGSVLIKFDDTYDELSQKVHTYSIRFITADGRLRTMNARKNVKSPKQQLRAPLQRRGKGKFNLKRHGTMQVQDVELGQIRAIKVATICAFKDFNSNIWHNVRH